MCVGAFLQVWVLNAETSLLLDNAHLNKLFRRLTQTAQQEIGRLTTSRIGERVERGEAGISTIRTVNVTVGGEVCRNLRRRNRCPVRVGEASIAIECDCFQRTGARHRAVLNRKRLAVHHGTV